MALRIAVIGTGTCIGKTYVAERILLAAGAAGLRACGYKPVESGLDPSVLSGTDGARLATASSFHVKPPLARQLFAAPISAHLAAEREGAVVDVGLILSESERGAAAVDLFLLELPGGAFSPIVADVVAADVLRRIPRIISILVAPDRLGVLHEVLTTVRASASIGLPIHGIVLNAPEVEDPSTGTNASQLPRFTRVPVLATLPRDPLRRPGPADTHLLRGLRALAPGNASSPSG